MEVMPTVTGGDRPVDLYRRHGRSPFANERGVD